MHLYLAVWSWRWPQLPKLNIILTQLTLLPLSFPFPFLAWRALCRPWLSLHLHLSTHHPFPHTASEVFRFSGTAPGTVLPLAPLETVGLMIPNS